ncbi:MAG: hypothetical protein EBR30_25890, partial [Cytophagia bacterium]|nr:hypothetical protein [Cytophagia bacterium]
MRQHFFRDSGLCRRDNATTSEGIRRPHEANMTSRGNIAVERGAHFISTVEYRKMAMFPKLPPVISNSSGVDVIDALPLREPVAKEAVADGKRFVIVCSRDLSAEDEAIFKQHGKTLRWKKESFLNLPFEQLDFDFLFID